VRQVALVAAVRGGQPLLRQLAGAVVAVSSDAHRGIGGVRRSLLRRRALRALGRLGAVDAGIAVRGIETWDEVSGLAPVRVVVGGALVRGIGYPRPVRVRSGVGGRRAGERVGWDDG